MEIYSTEEQQVEAIKSFWKENGTQIIIGAVLGFGGFIGWNTYVDHKLAKQEEASASYEKYLEATETAVLDSADAELKKFTDAHGDSGYAIFVNLLAAKKAVSEAKFESALEYLNQAAAKTTDESLLELVKVRIARVQIELKQYEQALSTLAQVKNEGYAARVAELKGDVFLAQGDKEKARVEFQAAADKGGLENNAVLKMKLDDVALSVKSAS